MLLPRHVYGLTLAKLLFIHSLLLLQKCEFLLLDTYRHFETVFLNIPHEHYVSINSKPCLAL